MKSDIDEVSLQGIEFWSSVCDEEVDLAIEASEVSTHLVTSGTLIIIVFRMAAQETVKPNTQV